MIISLRLNEVDGVLLKKYAEYHNETVSAFIRKLVMNQIQKDYDVLCERCEKYNSREKQRQLPPKPPVSKPQQQPKKK